MSVLLWWISSTSLHNVFTLRSSTECDGHGGGGQSGLKKQAAATQASPVGSYPLRAALELKQVGR